MPVLREDSVLIMNIRFAQETDLDSILKVIETAFSDEENKVIMNLAQELHQETTSPSIKSKDEVSARKVLVNMFGEISQQTLLIAEQNAQLDRNQKGIR